MKNTRLACLTALLAGFSLVALGCQTEVIGGGGSGGDQSTTTGGNQDTTTGTTGGNQGAGGSPVIDPPPPDLGPVIALLYSQLPDPNVSSGSGVTTTGGGPGIDPNTLMIFVGNESRSCADPYQDIIGTCGAPRYVVTVALPPNLQAVGSYPLQNLATFGESGSSGQPGDCWGGGGSYWDGTINVTAIDAQSVTFTLSGTGSLSEVGLTSADGTYTAPRCP